MLQRAKYIVIYVCLLFVMARSILFVSVRAQINNLVLNGSLEEYISCPVFTESLSNPEVNLVKYWSSPTYSSPDYFHICNPSLVPSTPRGYQYPHSGNAFAGILCYAHKWNFAKEYIQGALQTPLENGVTYYVEFYASLCRIDYRYPISNIDVYFSDTLVYYGSTITLSMFEPQVKNERTNIIKDTLNWVKISGTFTAKGGEKYLIIGNFNDSTDVVYEFINTPFFVDGSYYFIDDVAVYACADTNLCREAEVPDTFYLYIPNVFTPNADGKNDTWQVKASGVQQLYAAVYNRWGSLLWQQEVFADSAQNELNLSWDGRSSTGMPASAGTYYYLVTCTTKEGEIKKEKGFLTLTN